jgi:hypothetical protein
MVLFSFGHKTWYFIVEGTMDIALQTKTWYFIVEGTMDIALQTLSEINAFAFPVRFMA